MNSSIAEIKSHGWTGIELDVPESDLATYAQLANTVIELAIQDADIDQALQFDASRGRETDPVRTALYGHTGTGARNSQDEKHTLHLGYGSQAYTNSRMPEPKQPAELRSLWKINQDMLAAVQRTSATALRAIGAEALLPTIFPSSLHSRNVHLRTVRYVGAQNQPIGNEVVSGHGDLGLATLHLFETHKGWLKGATFPAAVMMASDSPNRAATVRAIREGLRPLEPHDNTVPFFLGATWQTFPGVTEGLRDLPGCYHAGFVPERYNEVVSPYAASVNLGQPDRVAVISFLHPGLDHLGHYRVPSIENCRPKLVG